MIEIREGKGYLSSLLDILGIKTSNIILTDTYGRNAKSRKKHGYFEKSSNNEIFRTNFERTSNEVRTKFEKFIPTSNT